MENVKIKFTDLYHEYWKLGFILGVFISTLIFNIILFIN